MIGDAQTITFERSLDGVFGVLGWLGVAVFGMFRDVRRIIVASFNPQRGPLAIVSVVFRERC